MKHGIAGGLAFALGAMMLAGCSAEAKRGRLLERAADYFAAGEYEKAKVTYLNVLRDAPTTALAHERLGTIWLEQGSPVRALPYLLQAREFAPGDAALRTRLARAYAGSERVTDARREALAVVRESVAHGDALLLLAETIRSRSDHDFTLAELKKSPVRQQPIGVAALVHLLLVKQEFEPAEKALAAAFKRSPNAAELHAAQAMLLTRRGQREPAEQAWARAGELAAARSPVRARWAEFLAEGGDDADAARQLQELIRATPDFLPLRRALARVQLRRKEFAAVEEQIRFILYQDNTNVDAYFLLADLHVAKGEPDAAVVRLAKLQSEHPKLAMVTCRLAWGILQAGDVAQATAVLRTGLRHDPTHVDSRLLLAEIYLREQRAEGAVQVLAGVLQEYPQHARGQALLADALTKLGRLDELGVVLRERLRVEPNAAELHVLLGRIAQHQERFAEAQEHYETALGAMPGHLTPLTALIELEVRRGDLEAALRRLQAARTGGADTAHWHRLEAGIRLAGRQWDAAESALAQAVLRDPNDARVFNHLKAAFDARPRASGVPAILDEVLARQPENLRAWLLRGIIHGEHGEMAKARAAYERVLAVQPDAPIPLNNFAAILAEEPAQLERALGLAMRARSLQPQSAPIADTLGWILNKRGDHAGALPLIEEAAARMPENPEIQFHLAIVNLHLGHIDVARAALQRAGRATQEFPGKLEIPARLAALEQAAQPRHE